MHGFDGTGFCKIWVLDSLMLVIIDDANDVIILLTMVNYLGMIIVDYV